MWLRSGKVHRLTGRYREDVRNLCAIDPVASILAAVNVPGMGIGASNMLGVLDLRLTSAAWYGANLVPVRTSHSDRKLYADYVASRPRACSSIVGPAEEVLDLWTMLQPVWGEGSEVRACQPSLVATRSRGPIDPRVRPATLADAEMIAPASVAMFTEEVGYDPTAYGPGYLARVYELARAGHTFIRTGPDGRGGQRVEFKADIGALAGGVAQIQGVWTAPDLRGQGIGTGGMAAVIDHITRTIAPRVSLYVNDYNQAALAVYERTGFTKVGEYATVLLA